MKKPEFIKVFCELTDAGRVKRFPDMRPSERAFAAVSDTKKAEQVWRKHRAYLLTVTAEQFKANEDQARQDDPQPEAKPETELIPEMPAWFSQYLKSLTVYQRDELVSWMNCGDDAAVMDTLSHILEGGE